MIVIRFIDLEYVHILHSPPFLGLNTVGTAQGLKLSQTNPLFNNSCTCLLISAFSAGVILYTTLFGKLALGIKSM